MRRIVLVIAGIAAAVGVALLATRFTTSAPVYTVAQVQAGLVRDPGAWVGRTVLVRGALIGSLGFGVVTLGTSNATPRAIWVSPRTTLHMPMPSTPPPLVLSLVDAPGAPSARPLPVTFGPPNAILSWLRSLPLVGPAMPRPQLLHWGESGVYRVTIQAAPSQSCGARLCYQAEALDATVAPAAQRWGPVFMVPLSGSATVRITSRLTTVRPAPLVAMPTPAPLAPAAP